MEFATSVNVGFGPSSPWTPRHCTQPEAPCPDTCGCGRTFEGAWPVGRALPGAWRVWALPADERMNRAPAANPIKRMLGMDTSPVVWESAPTPDVLGNRPHAGSTAESFSVIGGDEYSCKRRLHDWPIVPGVVGQIGQTSPSGAGSLILPRTVAENPLSARAPDCEATLIRTDFDAHTCCREGQGTPSDRYVV